MTTERFAPQPTDIAIIGMSARVPGARCIEQFWQNLCDDVDAATPLGASQMQASGVSPDLYENPLYVRSAYLLDGADTFDSRTFRYSPREAKLIDPQQRVLLQLAHHTMETAGYGGAAGRHTGVFAGCSLNTYLLHSGMASHFAVDPVLALMSSDKDFLATRIAFKLGLEGPALTVQTACSTSLTAVHQACQSLLAGECDMALAGGVCVKVPLHAGYLYREGGMLSRDGRCRPFDAAASGTVFGSGAGLVLLKRHAEALADRDNILAVIKASATNNDGRRKSSYTAPSIAGVADVMAQALEFGSVDPETIGYLECHGTGTALGDPLELSACNQAYRRFSAKQAFCAVGSVKGHIGHLEAAAGISGLIKTVLCLKNAHLPGIKHFSAANASLELEGSPFFINGGSTPWSAEAPRRAQVNSLGVGGTNASVVLEEAAPAQTTPRRREWVFLPVSAAHPAPLAALGGRLQQHLSEQGQGTSDAVLEDAAYTLLAGRAQHPARTAWLWRSGTTQPVLVGSANGAGNTKAAPPLVFVAEGGQESCSVEKLAKALNAWERHGYIPAVLVACGSAMDAAAQLFGTSATDMRGGRADKVALFTADATGQYTLVKHAHGEDGFTATFAGLPNALVLPLDGTNLASGIAEQFRALKATVLTPLAVECDAPILLRQLAQLWLAGFSVDAEEVYRDNLPRRVPLPVAPLQEEKCWW